ncbi:hypothetical protein GCM10012287_49520 [Streptomyces daqingensis]|uniref:Uncharacterized protein n=1 Tax=Streptomyces daqingensis TaxID=1472640 RepID=A0ABQ2MUP1_9ACTN|nr:hypothetical protein GCM10012287_49520 [Streptomyces daqingensis]
MTCPLSRSTAPANIHSWRTATNVAGQAVVPVLVAAREKVLDREKFAGARSFDLDSFEAEPERDAAAAVA